MPFSATLSSFVGLLFVLVLWGCINHCLMHWVGFLRGLLSPSPVSLGKSCLIAKLIDWCQSLRHLESRQDRVSSTSADVLSKSYFYDGVWDHCSPLVLRFLSCLQFYSPSQDGSLTCRYFKFLGEPRTWSPILKQMASASLWVWTPVYR